jgi:SagB-type dehydrogenase family enzyme
MARLQSDLATVFQKRRSSFGRLSNAHPLSAGELGTLLFGGCAARNYRSDLKEADGTPHFARIMAFVNNVKGIEQGIYAYDPLQHCLWTVQTGSFSHFLQKLYFLPNYNMEQTGAVLTIVGKVRSMLEAYGNRGYRLLCAEVGMVAQGLYMTSTALSFGCGAILGFNNVEINKALGLDGTDERSFLLLPVGHQRPGDASFDLPLV